jgi:hypothetical protein
MKKQNPSLEITEKKKNTSTKRVQVCIHRRTIADSIVREYTLDDRKLFIIVRYLLELFHSTPYFQPIAPLLSSTSRKKMSILAQTKTTTTRLVQLPTSAHSFRLAVSKEYRQSSHQLSTQTSSNAAIANGLKETILSLRHPNIVTVRRIDVSGSNSVHVTSDFVKNAGDLHNILQTRLRTGVYLTEKEIMPIFVQVALGVKYLHDNHVCHGVLQPRNILVGEARESDSGRSGGVTVRFTDYGVGHVCGDDVAE